MIDFDNKDLAMLVAFGLGLASIVYFGPDAKDIILFILGGVFALAENKYRGAK